MTTSATPAAAQTVLGTAAADASEVSPAPVGTPPAAPPTTPPPPAPTAPGGEPPVPGTPEAKAAAAKVAAEKTAAELAAKPFTDVAQLKLAEGVKLDEAAMKDFLPIAKEHGLTAKQAQALVEYDAKRGAAMESARESARETAQKAAVEALKADKEIGGANYDASMKLAGRALATIGSPELNKALNELRLEDGSMLGDSLVFARVLVNLGKRVSEDTLGNTHGAQRKTAANDEATFLREMYGETKTLSFP